MADIAPLGFAIDTSALEKAQQAAQQFSESLKNMAGTAGQAQQASGGLASGVSTDTQKINQATQAAEALAKANKAVADSANAAQQAQTNLANAPKPTPTAGGPTNMIWASPPVQAKSGGFYADQATADWADGMAAKRAAASAAEQAALQAANVRRNPLTPIGAGITGTAIAGAAGAAGGGITEALEDTADAADAAEGAMGRMAGRAGMLGVVGAAVGAALGAGLVMVLKEAATSLITTGDEAVLLERRLQAITGTSEQAARSIEGLTRAARESRSETRDQQSLRIGLERGPLDSDSATLDRFGATMAQIDQIGGNRAADFDQLGGKIASAFKDGRVELGELNAMLDQSPALAAKLEDGFGANIDAIRQMAADGNLWADDFIADVDRVGAKTRDEFGRMAKTSEAATTEMGQAWDEFWKEISEGSGLNSLSSRITSQITQGLRDAKTIIDSDGLLSYLLIAGNRLAETERAAEINERDGNVTPTPSGLPIVGARPSGPGGQIGAPRPGGRVHTGRDFGADAGTPVTARADGVVTNWQRDLNNSTPGGNAMTVRFEDGSSDYYAHLQNAEGNYWRRGTPFAAGTMLARTGNSGSSTSGPHLHITSRDADGNLIDPVTRQRVNPRGQPVTAAPAAPAATVPTPGTGGQTERANELMQSGATAAIANLERDIAALEAQPASPQRDSALANARNRLQGAKAAELRLNDTNRSRAEDSAADQVRGREIGGGGGGLTIGTAAARSYRLSTEAGFTDATEQDFLNIGITGAVAQSQSTTDRVSMQADAEGRRTIAAGRSRLAMEQERINEQVEQFQFQNFGTLEDGKITAAVNSYREALERLTAAQRATANAQSLLNAQNEAGVEKAASDALAAGQRGYAVELARQAAEEAVLASNGGDVAGARVRFNARNTTRTAGLLAGITDEADAGGRRLSIGGDAYARRQFDRAEELRQAQLGVDPESRDAVGATLASRNANEDAQAAKDRRDADSEGMRVAERQLELQGLVGRSRREALAVMERENDLVAQGLLPAGGRLLETEEASVRANVERLRLIQQQVETMEEIDAIAGNTADAVGGGARSLFADLFDDGRVEAEKFVSVIQGVVSRIGTNIADVLLVRPLERATEAMAEQAVDWVQNAMRGGRGSSPTASAGAGGAADLSKAVAATISRTSADTRAAAVTISATSAMAALTKSAAMAAAALANVGGGEATKNVGAAIAKAAMATGPTKGAAFGDSFGGIGSTPTLFQMAGGMGLAFEAGPEAVLPLKRGPDGRLGVGGGGGEGVSITVIDQRSGAAAPVETSESKGPDGRRMISMLIRDETRAAVRDGDMDAPMRDTYGLSRQIARR